MSKPATTLRGRPALEILEDAVRLLRRAPAPVHLAHFLGSAPCMLYAVYFFADMSRSAFAGGHVVGEALKLAALYSWMKCWQSISAAHLRAALLRQPRPRWDAGLLVRIAAAQTLLHPIGLVLRFTAGTLLLPYVWTATFFQNVTVLGDGTQSGVRELCATAWAEAKRWPRQAHGIAALLTVFGSFVYLNFTSLVAAAPMLLKSFLGIESVFSHYMQGLLNPTFFAAIYAMTYLLLDPIRKAAVAVRCFHGRSIQTGEDLAVEMKQIRRANPARIAAFALVIAFQGFAAAPVHAAAEAPRVESSQLDRSIDDVLERREFTWRAHREKEPELTPDKMNAFQKWMRDFKAWKQRIIWQTGRTLGRLLHRIEEWLSGGGGDSSRTGGWWSWLGSVRVLMWVVLVAALTILAVLIARRGRKPVSEKIEAEAVTAAPDLREEEVTADRLPEDQWMQIAGDLLDRGELRLAMRAFYLAGLAHLGSRELIRLARHKSNLDYDRELRRRARTQPELLSAFSHNLDVFEAAWYGDHPVTGEVLDDFSATLQRIRAC